MAKKYALYIEDDMVAGLEVDGRRYDDAEEIPDPTDRARMNWLVLHFPEADMAAPMPGAPPNAMGRIILLAFGAVAVLLLGIATIIGVNTARRLAREVSAPGRVVDLLVRQNEDGSRYAYPLVEVDLPDGTRQTVQLSEGSWPPSYEEGETVTVLLDPAQPGQVRIRSFGSTIGQWIVTIILGILGLAFAGATVFAAWVNRSDPTISPLARL